MKNDLFFMATCLLTVWKEESHSKHTAVSWADNTFSDYKTYLIEANQDPIMFALEIFGDSDVEFEESNLYLTSTPSETFIKVARNKKVERIVFINNKNIEIPNEQANFLIPFNYSFGKIIDILSQFDVIGRS
jgi:spore germination protein YaaH